MNIRKITEEEVRSLWVQRLSDTPNRAGRFGTPGLTAAEIKATYDALALRIVERYNELVDDVLSGEVMHLIKTGRGEDTLADLFRDVQSGRLAEWLTVDGTRSLARLAAAYDSHTHDGEYAPLRDGRIPASVLPESYESAYAEAEQERMAAEREREAEEAERRAAEARREALSEALSETIAEVEERSAALGRVLDEAEAKAEETKTLASTALLRTAKLEKRVDNLLAAAEGTAFSYREDTSAAYEKLVPEDSLPYAAIRRLGGGGVGANALYPSADCRLTDDYRSALGHSDGRVLYQTGVAPGRTSYWEGFSLTLSTGVTYTVALDVYVPPSIGAEDNGSFHFGLFRAEEGRTTVSIPFSVSERGTWVRRAFLLDGPTCLSPSGSYTDSGFVMLAYTGAALPTGESVRFARFSVTRGTGSVYHAPEDGDAVKTTAVVVRGRNLISCPYPAAARESTLYGVTITQNENGSITLSGVAERNISYPLYTDANHLALPEGEVTLARPPIEGVDLFLKTEENVRRRDTFLIKESDPYFGHYYLYLYIHEGTQLDGVTIQPFLCRGNPKPTVPYLRPKRYAVPDALLRLASYGRAENYYDTETTCFYGIVDLFGKPYATPTVTGVGDFLDGGVIPVEAGGSLVFENASGDAVFSHVIFETKL